MAVERRRAGVGFWFWWLVIGAVGFGVAKGVLGAVNEAGDLLDGYEASLNGAIAGAVIGLVLGFLQWLILKWPLTRPGAWVVASVMGFALGGGLAGPIEENLRSGLGDLNEVVVSVVVGLVVGVVIGASAGIVQWLVLAPQVPRGGWWIIASTFGIAIGLAVGLSTGDLVLELMLTAPSDPVLGMAATEAMVGALAGATYGLITATWLTILLRRPIQYFIVPNAQLA